MKTIFALLALAVSTAAFSECYSIYAPSNELVWQSTVPPVPMNTASLNAEVQKAIQLPDVRARLEALGGEARGSTPQEMKERVVSDVARWKKVITDSKIPQQ